MRNPFVWWTSPDDWDRVNTLRSGGVLPTWPGYLKRSFRTRGLPSNVERIIASSEFGSVEIEMVVGTPEHTISVGAVGIVVDARDLPAVATLPGFVTDTQMNFVSSVPVLERDNAAGETLGPPHLQPVQSRALGAALKGVVQVVEQGLSDLGTASPGSRRQGLGR